MSRAYSDLLNANWSGLPGDMIDSIVPYLSAWEVYNLCLYNDTFNRRICQNEDSVVWKVLFQRDISNDVPTNHIESRYFDIMNEILPLGPQQRLVYGAKNGYNEIVKSALKDGAYINANVDQALHLAAENGHTETVKLLLDRGADIHAMDDAALYLAAKYGRTETVKLLLDRGAKIHAFNDFALNLAAEYGRPETFKLLLAYGATITPEIKETVEWSGNPEIIALLK